MRVWIISYSSICLIEEVCYSQHNFLFRVVEFSRSEYADRAIRKLNGIKFMGRPVFVREVQITSSILQAA